MMASDNPAYPRDLIGYAGQPPDPLWPNGARIAVSIVLNVEEGGEYSMLHGDGHAEYALTDAGVTTPLRAT
jgi:allantoinase